MENLKQVFDAIYKRYFAFVGRNFWISRALALAREKASVAQDPAGSPKQVRKTAVCGLNWSSPKKTNYQAF